MFSKVAKVISLNGIVSHKWFLLFIFLRLCIVHRLKLHAVVSPIVNNTVSIFYFACICNIHRLVDEYSFDFDSSRTSLSGTQSCIFCIISSPKYICMYLNPHYSFTSLPTICNFTSKESAK